ncbi:MAG TPA: hypothetical protein PKY82_34960 [Pyrinomonadaceae bacterium]|nr:hypothetical protein [Pyrinomonadaceae bacterium]
MFNYFVFIGREDLAVLNYNIPKCQPLSFGKFVTFGETLVIKKPISKRIAFVLYARKAKFQFTLAYQEFGNNIFGEVHFDGRHLWGRDLNESELAQVTWCKEKNVYLHQGEEHEF